MAERCTTCNRDGHRAGTPWPGHPFTDAMIPCNEIGPHAPHQYFGMTWHQCPGKVSQKCEATDGLSHSSDLVEVYRGSATPTLLCGKHAQSA